MALSWDPTSIARRAAAYAAAQAGAQRVNPAATRVTPAPTPRTPAKPGQAVSTPQPDTGPWSPLSEDEINRQADERAAAAIRGQSDPIRTAARQAAERALGAQGAMVGFTGAGQAALGNVGNSLSAAYGGANISMPAGSSPEAGGFAAADQGAIKGTGQAAASWGSQLGAIQGNLGQENLASLIASAEGEQADYAQKLIDVAAKQPELRQQAIDALHDYELKKLDARLGIAKDKRDTLKDERDYKLSLRDMTVRERAEKATELATLGKLTAPVKLRIERLADGSTVAVDPTTGSVVKQIAGPGEKIPKTTKLADGRVGVINADGTVTAAGGDNPAKAPGAGKGTPYQKAVKEAKTISGKPILVAQKTYTTTAPMIEDKNHPGTFIPDPLFTPTPIKIRGKYIARDRRPGEKWKPYSQLTGPGKYVRSTDNARYAKRDSQYDFNGAVVYLVNLYGITPARAKAALRAAGWVE
jgi:hypothetical protein